MSTCFFKLSDHIVELYVSIDYFSVRILFGFISSAFRFSEVCWGPVGAVKGQHFVFFHALSSD